MGRYPSPSWFAENLKPARFPVVYSIIVAAVGFFCGQVYNKARLSIKRERSNARAPIVGHVGSAIAGLVSIRAYGAENRVIQECMNRIDRHTRTTVALYNLNRWLSLRTNLLSGVFATSLAAYLVYGRGESARNTGFALNMAIGFSANIMYWVRNYNDFQLHANSLERIAAYSTIEQEPEATSDGKPPAYWPASGTLKVERLSARYASGGPRVLYDLSFEIRAGERIGVVGRTGAGKSSLTLALLRCIFTEGQVYYDGISTGSLNLEDLRSNVTIIPQMVPIPAIPPSHLNHTYDRHEQPELLSGTLRQNLDPFEQHDDSTLHSALRAAGLYSLQDAGEESRLTLDSAIASGGGNLSVGQRQILALARALVRGSKLLILDEATSAIDYKTDAIIQSSLRNELPKDVTVITIAHRLQTIMDADKILVLDEGRMVEFDSARNLLQKENGALRALIDESNDKALLYSMIKGEI
ncbi:hypothetical protein V5O48_002566 [Marasmius crinis-equi]|uniref:ABC transporter domain-containing protein n=1 Tax=Marasmius crinis-equi TaxID=585013 RepID=A0ABR3FVQ2_9AGAR